MFELQFLIEEKPYKKAQEDSQDSRFSWGHNATIDTAQYNDWDRQGWEILDNCNAPLFIRTSGGIWGISFS